MADVEERVDRLEKIVPEFVLNVGIEFNKLYNTTYHYVLLFIAVRIKLNPVKDASSSGRIDRIISSSSLRN